MLKLLQKYKAAKMILANRELKDFVKTGFINETAVRNCKIIEEYYLLRKEYEHLAAIEELIRKTKFHSGTCLR